MSGCFLMSGSENTALFERLMEIHSNSPKLYYGFKRHVKFQFELMDIKICHNAFNNMCFACLNYKTIVAP